jgi:hypothetical protein
MDRFRKKNKVHETSWSATYRGKYVVCLHMAIFLEYVWRKSVTNHWYSKFEEIICVTLVYVVVLDYIPTSGFNSQKTTFNHICKISLIWRSELMKNLEAI